MSVDLGNSFLIEFAYTCIIKSKLPKCYVPANQLHVYHPMKIVYVLCASQLAVLSSCSCATGEAWQNVMMACVNSPMVKCDINSEDRSKESCGSNFAYAYFVSFYMICSFLVRCVSAWF